MDQKQAISDHSIHTGAVTSLVLAWLGLIPGFIPTLALTVLLGVVLVAPFAILGLATVLIATPAYAVWRLVRRARRPMPPGDRKHGVGRLPVPSSHTS